MRDHQNGFEDLAVDIDPPIFMRRILREMSGTLETIIGLDDAEGFLSCVGTSVGSWVEEEYRKAIPQRQLDVNEVARLLVDLKGRIGADFRIISVTADEIVLGNRRCPFGDSVVGRPALCSMTSHVVGRVVAEHLGYARVDLTETLARGDGRCRVVIALRPEEISATEDPDTPSREFWPLAPSRMAAE